MEVEELRDIVRQMNEINMEQTKVMKDMNERIHRLENASKAMFSVIEILMGVRQIPIQHTCNDINPTSVDICPACLKERYASSTSP